MHTIAVNSPSNIAFVKYWGQRDSHLTLPFNDSLSMNLSSCVTTVEMDVLDDPSIREMVITEYGTDSPRPAREGELRRVTEFYTVARTFLGSDRDFGFRIRSANSFPQKAGIASSASFFSAMALAFARAFEVNLEPKRLSVLARLSGSGSACRSIPDGFVLWHTGTGLDSSSSFAESIAEPDFWDIADVVIVVSSGEKKVSSVEGHMGAPSSPYFRARQLGLPETISDMKDAFLARDLSTFGPLMEQEAINFHAIMMSQVPPLFYWSGATLDVLREIVTMRAEGQEAYFTIDAGENVHVICRGSDAETVRGRIAAIPAVKDTIVNYPAVGARLV
jgi:diphosphomevalonate decarboxylase